MWILFSSARKSTAAAKSSGMSARSQFAAERGLAVHQAARDFLKHGEIDLPSKFYPYWDNIWKSLSILDIKPIWIEGPTILPYPICSKVNSALCGIRDTSMQAHQILSVVSVVSTVSSSSRHPIFCIRIATNTVTFSTTQIGISFRRLPCKQQPMQKPSLILQRFL